MRRALALASALTLILFSAASATITAISVTNNSSPDDFVGGETFQTQSTILPVVATVDTAYFNHQMAFRNQHTATGGVAQVHKRNVVYTIDFTVQDPSNYGFTLDASSVLYGRSEITLTSEGSATATGASFFVEFDDSTDAPGTFSTLTSLFNSTPGVSVDDFDSASNLVDNFEETIVGSYVGTTSFTFSFSTVPTPTTNVFFGNNQTGSGEVDYLSSPLYGHSVKFTATYEIPEPSSVVLVLGIALGGTLGRRLTGWD